MPHWLIVGGGTAGCVLASLLTEDARNHVTLVEAGSDRGPRSPSYLDDLFAPGALWEGLEVTDGGGPSRPYPQGRGIGGSSAVSGGVLSGGDGTDLGQILGRRSIGAHETGQIDRALLGAATDATTVTVATTSVADAYLARATGRPNVDVLTDTAIARIDLRARRASGVVTAAGERLDADRVVCAAGAIHTPALLLRSGVDTPGVGAGLADHPGRTVDLLLRADTEGDAHALVTGAVLRRGSIEIVAMNHLGPDVPGKAALLVGLLDAERRGTVRLDPLHGEDPAIEPLVDFGPLAGNDAGLLAEGIGLARELAASETFRDVVDAAVVADGLSGYAHATSTCAIGTVADEHGAVFGYGGLYVADSSALTASPGSGTLLPVVALAERLAHRWLEATP
jgi:choline dehydrogenase-like flavoprotein